MSRHLITTSCDPAWCAGKGFPLPVSLNWAGTWQVHQWHHLAEPDDRDGIETRCEDGAVKVLLGPWELSHILDDDVASQRCEHCWDDDTWAAMARLVEHAATAAAVP